MKQIWLVIATLVLAGCAGVEESAQKDAVSASPTLTVGVNVIKMEGPQIVAPDVVPPVDMTRHSVPMEEIYFDTFRSVDRAVRLTDAEPALIERLRDAIAPLHQPVYESGDAVDWLADDDMVIGYASGGQAWAYPLRILNYHEIVNDRLGGDPVLISFCPLCYSGIVYSRELEDGRELVFGNTSALYESDMVMVDYESGTYWWQVAGQGIVGPMTGTQLEILPSMTTTWAGWRELYPESLVLSRETGHPINYGRDPFLGIEESLDRYRFAFPVSKAGRDARLSPGTRVLVVALGEESRAFALGQTEGAVVMDVISDQRVVVFFDPKSASANGFFPETAHLLLTFAMEDGKIVDSETGSTWDMAGRATSGSLAGEQLKPVAAKMSFWYATVASDPDIIVVAP